MAKILGISSSPRKKSGTTHMVKLALEEAEKLGMETELVTLRNKKINPCIHCDKAAGRTWTGVQFGKMT